jgi:hypothetical protein
MWALLTPRFWLGLALVAALSFTHGFAYKSGRAAVRNAWDAEKLATSEASRIREKALTIETTKVDHALQKSKARDVAAGRAAADSLHDLKTTLAERDNAPTASGAHGTGGLERELLGSCATALAEMAITADRLETKVVGLQAYARGVCLAGGNE